MNDETPKPTDRPQPENDARISAYIDGQLPPDELAEFEELLRTDASYQLAVDEMRRVSRSIQSLPRMELGDGFSKRVMQAVHSQQATAGESAQPASVRAAGVLDNETNAGDRQRIHPVTRPSGSWRKVVYAVAALAAGLVFVVLSPSLNPFSTGSDRVAFNLPSLTKSEEFGLASPAKPNGMSNQKQSSGDTVSEFVDLRDDIGESEFTEGKGLNEPKNDEGGATRNKFAETDSMRRHRTDTPADQSKDNEPNERALAASEQAAVVPPLPVPASKGGAGNRLGVIPRAKRAAVPRFKVPLDSAAAPGSAADSVATDSPEFGLALKKGKETRSGLKRWNKTPAAPAEVQQHLRFVNERLALALEEGNLSFLALQKDDAASRTLRRSRGRAKAAGSKDRIAVVSLSPRLGTRDFLDMANASGIEVRYGTERNGRERDSEAESLQAAPSPAFGGAMGGMGGGALGKTLSESSDRGEDGAVAGRSLETAPARTNNLRALSERPPQGAPAAPGSALKTYQFGTKEPVSNSAGASAQAMAFVFSVQGPWGADQQSNGELGLAGLAQVEAADAAASDRGYEGDDIAGHSNAPKAGNHILEFFESEKADDAPAAPARANIDSGMTIAAQAAPQPKGRYVLVEATPEVMKKFVVSVSAARSDNPWYYFESTGDTIGDSAKTEWEFDQVRVARRTIRSNARVASSERLNEDKASSVVAPPTNERKTPSESLREEDSPTDLFGGISLDRHSGLGSDLIAEDVGENGTDKATPGREFFDDDANGIVTEESVIQELERQQPNQPVDGENPKQSGNAGVSTEVASTETPLVRVLFFLPDADQR